MSLDSNQFYAKDTYPAILSYRQWFSCQVFPRKTEHLNAYNYALTFSHGDFYWKLLRIFSISKMVHEAYEQHDWTDVNFHILNQKSILPWTQSWRQHCHSLVKKSFSTMWHSTQLQLTTSQVATKQNIQNIQNNPSLNYFSLRQEKPNLSERLSWLQARLQVCYIWVEHIGQKQPRWKRRNKKQIHACYHLHAQRETSLLATTLSDSYKMPLSMSFQETETIMSKTRIRKRTTTHTH